MKKVLIFAAALAMVAFASCDGDKTANPRDQNAVSFSASIIGAPTVTRASGTTWGADKIGVSMYATDQPDYPLCINHCYTTTGDGTFVHSDAANAIYYPADKSAVDFYAYYPHRAALSSGKFDIDVLDQTNPEAIDILFSNNVKNVTEGSQALVFQHKLARVVFNITYPDGPSLEGAQVWLSGVPRYGTMDVRQGFMGARTDSKVNIFANLVAEGSKATASFILLPSDAERTFFFDILLSNGESVTQTITATYQGGRIYTYPVTLKSAPKGTLMASSTATITDWTDVPQTALTLETKSDPNVSTTTEFDLVELGKNIAANGPIGINNVLIADGVQLEFQKGKSSNPPIFYVADKVMRMYGNNVLHVTGTDITRVEFTFVGADSNFTCATETYNAPVWTGTAASALDFVVTNSKKSYFTNVKVTHK